MEISNALTNSNNIDTFSVDYPIVFANHEIEVDIETPENITVTEEITILNNRTTSISNFVFNLNHPALILRIEDSLGKLNADLISVNDILINFRSSLGPNQQYIFRLIYKLDIELDFTQGKPTYYIFPFTSYIQYFTSKQHITIRLPSHSILHETDIGPPPYFPENVTEICTGIRLCLKWEFENLEPATEIPFLVFFDEPYSRPIPVWTIALILIVGIIAGAFCVFIVMQKREKRNKKTIGSIYLTDDQNVILRLVSQNEGKMSQKELLEQTNCTKSKISRNLTTLEKQGLIIKEKWGREFRVYLTKEGKRVVE